MICPKCGIELRVKKRTDDGRVLLVCKNPQCENCKPDIIVHVID